MADSVLITLDDGQTGYDAVARYIHNYWQHNGDFCDTVVVQFEISYNGKDFSTEYDVVYPHDYYDVEFLNDWWEGQKYILLRGIRYLREFNVEGGIYSE